MTRARVTSCYGMYTVGVNIKREMVLSPNDEDVASSEKHTQFKTRVHYPTSMPTGPKSANAFKHTISPTTFYVLPSPSGQTSKISVISCK